MIINHRGCENSITQKKITLHWDTDTISSGIAYLLSHYNPKSVVLVGISMGSFMITHYLQNPHPIVKGAILFSHYYSLQNHTQSVQSSMWLHEYVLHQTKSLYRNVYHSKNNQFNLPPNLRLKNLDQAIDQLILPYRNITRQHYLSIDTQPILNTINLPCYLINSIDDPLTSIQLLNQYQSNTTNPNITFLRTSYGGHLGWHVGFLSTITHTLLQTIKKNSPTTSLYSKFISKFW